MYPTAMEIDRASVRRTRMARGARIALLCALVVALPALLTPAPRLGASSLVQTLAIPSYFYPGPLWTQMEQGYPAVGLAIINPNNGPGKSKDSAYAAQVKHSQAVGLTVLGYVYTRYGRRTLSAVERDIDAYYAWYGVDGIFLDQASTSCAHEPYYASLAAYIKAKGGKGMVILNPGTQTQQCYMAAGDIIVNFEDTYANYVSRYSAPAWVSTYPPARFWHIVHSTPTDGEMLNAIALSKGRNAAWVYVTPDTPPNPYDTLPTDPYWSDELAAAHS